MYQLANGEVRWSRPGEPFDELLDVVLNLTPKHILLKILEGDSPTIRVATKELVKLLRGVGRKDDFRNIVEAVGRYHPEWTRQDRYLTLAAQVGCTDTCRLLLRMPHPPKYDSEYEDAVLTSIACGHLECAKLLCQHLIKPGTAILIQIIFAEFLWAAANRYYCPMWSTAQPGSLDFGLGNSCGRQMLNWFLEAGANVDVPAPIRHDPYTPASIYRHTPRFLVPTMLDYLYLEDFELYSLIVSHSVKFKTELTRSGIHRAAREGTDSLRLYLLSRPSHTLVQQPKFLGILLTEELVKPAHNQNLDFNVLYTLLDYNRSHPKFCSKLNVSAMLYHVVRASRRQGIHPSTPHIIMTLTHKGAVMTAETMAEAIEEEGTALLQLLSSSGADFKSQGALALCAAMRSGNYDAVSSLLDIGVDVNATLTGSGEKKYITVLARANCYMNPEYFYIFDYQVQLTSAPILRPMSYAMLEFLISRNVRLRARSSDPSFRELLYLIVTHGHRRRDWEGTFKKIRVLLNAEIITNDQSGTKPCLLEACFQDHGEHVSASLALVELFLDYGISARYSGVLAHMIRIGASSDKIQRVLDGGVDVNTYSGQNTGSGGLQRTPLQEAAGVGSLDLVQLLMQRGANVNLPPKGDMGRTALQRACEGEIVPVNVHLIKFLIANGANVNAPPAPYRGVTAFQAAAINGNFEVVLLLLDHGADINAPPAEEYGYCALDGAAACGKLDMVQFLLDLGALSHDGGESGYRGAIRVAERRGKGAIADMIRQYAVKTGKSGEEVSANYPWWEEEENSGTEHDSDDSYDSSEEIEDWEI